MDDHLKAGVLYAAHTGGKIGVPPREGVWENVDSWGHPGAPGGKHQQSMPEMRLKLKTSTLAIPPCLIRKCG